MLFLIPVLLLTLTACGVVSNLFLQPTATPIPTPEKGALLSRVVWDIGTDIYLSQGASGKLTKVISNPTMIITENPQLSPDGKKIVFEGETAAHLYVVNVDGTNLKKITPDDYTAKFPSWSPDGKSVIFSSMKSDKSTKQVLNALQIIDVDTLVMREINTNDLFVIDPVFSPDGQMIAYSSQQVYTMSVKGENIRQITSFTEVSLISENAWSPDGKRLLFRKNSTTELNAQKTRISVGYVDLYTINPDGSGLKQLTNNSESETDVFWMPDSKTIVFKSRSEDLKKFNEVKVYAIDANSLVLRLLSEVDTNEYRPKITATPIIPTATPRVKLIETPIKATLTFLSGPVDGSLTHQDGYITDNCTSKKVKDFMAEAVIYNPYATSKGKYDFGLLFKQAASDQGYRLSVNSGGSWRLTNRIGSTLTDISSGSVRVNTGEKDVNRIKLIASGNAGYFYLNDTLVSTLNLGARGDVGEVCIAVGITAGYKLAGEKTRFEDFNVWSLTTP